MSNLTQLTASLTSKYNLHHTFSHAPRPQIILKLKETIFKENISNSNGVDTTSNNFSDNILTNKRIKFNHMTPPCRERGTKHPRTTHHCLRSIQLRQRIFFLLEALFERVLQRMSIIGAKLEAQDPLRSVNEWVNCEEMSPILIPFKCWRCFVQCFRFKDWKIRIV